MDFSKRKVTFTSGCFMGRCTLLLLSILSYSMSLGQEPNVLRMPSTATGLREQSCYKYCVTWLDTERDSERAPRLLEVLESDGLTIPLRWRFALLASQETGYQELNGSGLIAQNVLPVRRKRGQESIGEVLNGAQPIEIELTHAVGPGGGYRLPEALLEDGKCYVIADNSGSGLSEVTCIDMETRRVMWKTEIPLINSLGQSSGPWVENGFKDIVFRLKDELRVMTMWYYQNREFCLAEIRCDDGKIQSWFSSKITDRVAFASSWRGKFDE